MLRPTRNKNLNEVPLAVLMKFCELLDYDSGWKQLLNVLPEEFVSKCRIKTQLAHEESIRNGRPSEFLLRKLGDYGTTVGDLIRYMENLGLDDALVLFKNFEPVTIVVDLPSEKATESNAKLVVECKATGFPKPKYRWFHLHINENGESTRKLLEYEDGSLSISSVSWEDEGHYVCEVYNENLECASEKSLVQSTIMKLKITAILHRTPSGILGSPVIIHQPCLTNQSPCVVGSSITLKCTAEGVEPITYEWYRNGVPFKVGNILTVENLRKENDDSKFEFQCRVSNRLGSVMSNLVKTVLASPIVPNLIHQHFAEDKVALLIGNASYATPVGELPSAQFDATCLALKLREMDFKVITLINLTKPEMEHAITVFSQLIEAHVYAVFYYAGHGFQRNGLSYMLPIDAESDYGPSQCLSLNYVLDKIQEHNPALCCMILDMCRRNISDHYDAPIEVAKEPVVHRNTIMAYSTSNTCTALDGSEGKNSVYMRHLLKCISLDKPVYEMLNAVVYDMSVESLASNKQYPQIVSNLGLPLKLTDKIETKEDARASKRSQFYYNIISHKPHFKIKGAYANTEIEFYLEPFDQVIHNILRIKMAIFSIDSNEKLFAVLNVPKDSEQPLTELNQLLDPETRTLDVHIYNLQRTREPVVLNVVTYSENGCAQAVQKVNIEFPMIAKIYHSLESATAVTQ
ncbi:Mucosa associated lymphoid tissue lymphoma translocation protein 1 [Chamberlinius hualienensis]